MKMQNNNFPDCSIIIVNFNNLVLLNNCVDSILKYTKGVSFEIIIVDNCSKDANIDKIKEKCSEIRIIKNPGNNGFATANNQGLGIARGRYILFLNNDTLFLENTLRKMIDFAELNGRDVILGCKILNVDRSLQVSLFDFDNLNNSLMECIFLYKIFPKSKFFNKYYLNYRDNKEPIEAEAVKGCFLFCSSEVVKRLGGLDERFHFYMEETDFCYRFKKAGGKVIYYPDSAIIHLGGATTDNLPWFKFQSQAIAKIKFYQKHFTGSKYFILILIHYIGLLLRIGVYLLMAIFTMRRSLVNKSYYYLRQLFIYPRNIFNK